MGRVGIFGGTFDPIHIGHLLAAEAAREALALDRIVFLPAARSPFKSTTLQSAAEDRLAMLALAIADRPDFGISRIDLDRPPPSYTVDSLTLLRDDFGPATSFFLIMGADALAEFPDWHRPEDILAQGRLAAVARPGTVVDWPALEARLPGLQAAVSMVPGHRIGISATDLRKRAAEDRSIRYQVPEPVRRYIADHGLYRAAGPTDPVPG